MSLPAHLRWLDFARASRNLEVVPTLSFHAPEKLARQVRAAARKRGQPVSRFLKEAAERESRRTGASFAEGMRPFIGLIKDAPPDLSMREGFGS